jgi:putative ABC transport system permease protein
MLRSYFITAFRYIIKNRIQSVIQIISLAIGLTFFTLVTLYLYDELTVDRLNENLEQVYRIEDMNKSSSSKARLPWPLAPLLLEEIPGIQDVTRVKNAGSRSYLTVLDESGKPGKQIFIRNSLAVDTGFQEIFPQDYLLGDPRTSLRDPYSVVLTRSISEKLFGSENPVGKTVYAGTEGEPRTVTGVIKDPLNTHLKFEMLQSASTWEAQSPGRSLKVWWGHPRPIYIKLDKNADREKVESMIEDAFYKLQLKVRPDWTDEPEIFLCPLKDVYFFGSDASLDSIKSGNRNVVLNFFLLGLAILLLGIINYVNLTLARAALRRREIVLRKIAGSSRFKLILYFLTESVITTFLSFLIAMTMLQLLFQTFNHLLQADINLYFLNDPRAWILGFLAILFIGILSGIYPAVRMSSGAPVMAISGDSRRSFGGLLTRRILMTIQYASAVMLMIGILVMHLQIRYMKDQDLGFNAERIVWIKKGSVSEMSIEHKRLLLSRLERYPEIEKACFTTMVPGTLADNFETVNNPESDFHGLHLDNFTANPEFFEVYGLKLTVGSETLDHIPLDKIPGHSGSADSIRYYIVNESYWKTYKGENPAIVGVVQDFHCRSLQHSIYPLVIRLAPTGEGHTLSIRMNSTDIPNTLRKVVKEIREVTSLNKNSRDFIPGPLTHKFEFIDETINRQYDQVQSINDGSLYLFIMAMIIACLGLFGLSSFMVQRRIKEIGIRKALGSSERQVFMMLSKDLAIWIGISVLIGCPLSWFLMEKWLQQFAYRISIGWWIFALAILIAFAIGFLTISWQAIKAARTNPIEALRYE